MAQFRIPLPAMPVKTITKPCLAFSACLALAGDHGHLINDNMWLSCAPHDNRMEARTMSVCDATVRGMVTCCIRISKGANHRCGQDLSWGWDHQRWCNDLRGIWANGDFTSNNLLGGFVGFC